MAAELRLLSLTQLQNLAQSHHHQQQQNPSLQPGSWMWNTKQNQEDDDSWEVRAFAQDTGSAMGTTWPPRSYTCTFCRREFRSAQALGGHMNVHRRDRAKLRQSPPVPATEPSLSSASSSAVIFPAQDFAGNGGGLCLFYSLQTPNVPFSPITSMTAYMESSPSTLLSISPYQTCNLVSPLHFTATTSTPDPLCHTEKLGPSVSVDDNNQEDNNNDCTSHEEETNYYMEETEEELDLELRLGSRPSPPGHKEA